MSITSPAPKPLPAPSPAAESLSLARPSTAWNGPDTGATAFSLCENSRPDQPRFLCGTFGEGAAVRHQAHLQAPGAATVESVAIAAHHPVLGWVYRVYVDESACNAADYYGITTEAAHATTVVPTWRTSLGLSNSLGDRFIDRLMSSTGSSDDRMYGHLLDLQQKSGQAPRDFYVWMRLAEWVDRPAPSLPPPAATDH